MKRPRFSAEQIIEILREREGGNRRRTSVGTLRVATKAGQLQRNAILEGFNGRMRDEFLNQRRFRSLRQAREEIETWRYLPTTLASPGFRMPMVAAVAATASISKLDRVAVGAATSAVRNAMKLRPCREGPVR